MRTDCVPKVLLNLLGTLEIGKWKIPSPQRRVDHRVSRKQVQEKAQIHRRFHERVFFEASTNTLPMFKFISSFIAMLCATAPVAILGTRFAMSVAPFWTPEQFSGRLISRR